MCGRRDERHTAVVTHVSLGAWRT